MSQRAQTEGPEPLREPEQSEVSTNFFDSWKNILQNVRKYWPGIIMAILFAAVGNILTVIGPSQIARMTDVISQGIPTSIDMEAIQSIGLTLILLYGIGAVLNYSKGWIMVTVTQEIARELRADISEKINKLPMSYYSTHTVGDTLSRVTNDVNTIAQSLNTSVSNLISSGTLLVGSLVMMLLTSVSMTFVAVGASLIGFLLMGLLMRTSQKYFVRQQNDLGDINGQIEEIYSGHPIVKAYNGEREAKLNFREKNASLRESGFKAQALSSFMMPIMTFIGNFGYVAVSVFGAYLTITGNISFGIVVAFTIYVRYFTQPLAQIAQASQSLQSASAAGERVFEFLNERELINEDNKPGRIEQTEGQVEFSNVYFSYDEADDPVIKNFSLQVAPGQKVALVGHTGAGKTTIVNLLMRFYEIDSGNIYIDGTSIQDIPRENLRNQFTMVLQDSWVFHGTIRENLLLNTENVTEAEIIAAAETVDLHQYIETLSEGYNTLLDEKIKLSQGQKQQLTIARALLNNRPILILDEATSSVDTRTEKKIQEGMDQLMEGRTSFVIAHRLSTIRDADLIVVMEDGEIIEKGEHDELLDRNGFYAELYNSQFDKSI